EGEQLAPELTVVVDVHWKGVVAADALRFLTRLDFSLAAPVHAVPQPFSLPLAEPSLERVELVLLHVGHREEAKLGEALLELRPHHRQLGQRERFEERLLAAIRHDAYAIGAEFRLCALDGK